MSKLLAYCVIIAALAVSIFFPEVLSDNPDNHDVIKAVWSAVALLIVVINAKDD